MGEKSRKTRPRVCPPNHRDNHSCSPALRAGEHEKFSEADTHPAVPHFVGPKGQSSPKCPACQGPGW